MLADCEFGAERVVLVVQLVGTGGRRRFDDVLEVKKSTDFPARGGLASFLVWSELLPEV